MTIKDVAALTDFDRTSAAPTDMSKTQHKETITRTSLDARVSLRSPTGWGPLAVETVRRDGSMWGAAKIIQPQSLLSHTLTVSLVHVNRLRWLLPRLLGHP